MAGRGKKLSQTGRQMDSVKVTQGLSGAILLLAGVVKCLRIYIYRFFFFLGLVHAPRSIDFSLHIVCYAYNRPINFFDIENYFT